MKTRYLALLLALIPLPGQSCPLKVVAGDGGTLFLVNTAEEAPDYVYAAVVKDADTPNSLEDILAKGAPLERARARKYVMPKNLPTGQLYVVTSSQKLDAHDRFLVTPAGAKELQAAAARRGHRSRGMSNYGGPLPQPAVSEPEVSSPTGVSVCSTKISRRIVPPLVPGDLP